MPVKLIDHPLIQDKLSYLRDKYTNVGDFRLLCGEMSQLMAYEATRDLPLKELEVDTPISRAKVKRLVRKPVALVGILRAGLVMIDGMLRVLPSADVGHIGLSRDPKTLKPMEYYCKLPPGLRDRQVFLLDPMLATGGSAVASIDLLKAKGAANIRLLCILGSREGVEAVINAHSDTDILLGGLDPRLNEKGYIVPGLGDAGDRIYGTR